MLCHPLPHLLCAGRQASRPRPPEFLAQEAEKETSGALCFQVGLHTHVAGPEGPPSAGLWKGWAHTPPVSWFPVTLRRNVCAHRGCLVEGGALVPGFMGGKPEAACPLIARSPAGDVCRPQQPQGHLARLHFLRSHGTPGRPGSTRGQGVGSPLSHRPAHLCPSVMACVWGQQICPCLGFACGAPDAHPGSQCTCGCMWAEPDPQRTFDHWDPFLKSQRGPP